MGRDGILMRLAVLSTALFPWALFVAQNHYALREVSHWTQAVLGVAALVIASFSLWWAPKTRPARLRLILFIVIGAFSYSIWQIAHAVIPTLLGYAATYGFVLVLAGSVIYSCAKRVRMRPWVDTGLFLVIGGTLALAVSRNPIHSNRAVSERDAGVDAENIYYIVLDGHAKADPQFQEVLARQGFTGAEDGLSNYSQTRQALAAIFNLDHHPVSKIGNVDTALHFPTMMANATAPQLILQLQQVGYGVFTTRSAVFGCQYRHAQCVSPPEAATLKGVALELASYTPMRAWKRYFQSRQSIDTPSLILAQQAALLRQKRPFFLFAHHLSPHPPYRYGVNCIEKPQLSADESGWEENDRPTFAHETQCLDQRMAIMTTQILRRDPTAIIVLQSDHGPWFGMAALQKTAMKKWPKRTVMERLSYLNQIKLPARCQQWLKPEYAQVNIARIVVACAKRVVPVIIPERAHLTSYVSDEVHVINP